MFFRLIRATEMWLYIFAAIVVLVLVFLHYSGLFYRPIVETGKGPFDGTFRVAYKFGRGPYQVIHVIFGLGPFSPPPRG